MTVSLILAAGSSSRMGEPKMLLMYKGKSLLQHVIDEVKSLENNLLVVVTGSYHDSLVPHLQQQGIPFIQNQHWNDGMGSSVSLGINYILQLYPAAENILVLTCDQPFISTNLLQQMIDERANSGKGIAACVYGNTVGIPVLFNSKYFNLLVSLAGKQGAKKIISGLMEDVVKIDFPEGAIDIDRPEDYARLLEENK